MGKSSGKQNAKKQKDQGRKKKGPAGRWTLGHVVTAFFIGTIFGFVLGYQPASEGGDDTDAYGRSPGDPHYEHSHP